MPVEWVLESTAPDSFDQRAFKDYALWTDFGGYYGYHFWGLRNSDGGYDFMAVGHLGQYIYVAPRKNIVIVRLGGETDSSVNWAFVLQSLVNKIPI